MRLYLLSLLCSKDIEGYNTVYDELSSKNEYYLAKNKRFPFSEYCLQSFQLPNSVKKHSPQTFESKLNWFRNENISKSLAQIKPSTAALQTLEINKQSSNSENKMDSDTDKHNHDDTVGVDHNNFGKCKQFLSSDEMCKISKQLLPNALQMGIAKDLTAKVINNHNRNNDKNDNHKNMSLFDMFYNHNQ